MPKKQSRAPCVPERTTPKPWPMKRMSSTSTSALARSSSSPSPDRARSVCVSSLRTVMASRQRAPQPPISPPTASPGWSLELWTSLASRAPTPSPACPSPIPSVHSLSSPSRCTLVTSRKLPRWSELRQPAAANPRRWSTTRASRTPPVRAMTPAARTASWSTRAASRASTGEATVASPSPPSHSRTPLCSATTGTPAHAPQSCLNLPRPSARRPRAARCAASAHAASPPSSAPSSLRRRSRAA